MTATRRLRVVHLITLLEFGGAQGNTLHTVRHLDPARFDAHLWCGKGGYWDADASAQLGPRLRFFPWLVRPIHPICDPLAVWDLARAFRRFKPDIVHTHSSKAGIVGRLAAHWAGVPTIVHTFHGFGFNREQKPWTRALFVGAERWTAPMTDALVFVSKANWAEARDLGLGSESRYRLIRSGVPTAGLAALRQNVDRAGVRAQLDVPAKDRLVTSLSVFKPQKNLDDFIRAAAAVARVRKDITFVILGDGALRKELTALAARLGVQDRMRLPGWRRDSAAILAASDAFVLTSLWEGLPRALVEACLLGVPPVCYDTDGVRDVLSACPENLIPQRDTAALANRLVTVLDAPDAARSRIPALGREFDIDQMVREQEALYEELTVRS